MRQLHVHLPDELADRLEDVVDETGLTKAELVRAGLLNRLNEVQA